MSDWIICLEKAACRRKCHGWILYAAQESGINMHYIDLYRKACKRYGMSVEFGTCQACEEVHQMSGGMQYIVRGKDRLSEGVQLAEMVRYDRPDYVINRTRDFRLAQRLESWGIPVFNCSWLAELGNDKAKAYRYMQQRSIPIMPAVYDITKEPPWYPAVIKSCAGHGGSEVYLIRDSREFSSWRQHIGRDSRECAVRQENNKMRQAWSGPREGLPDSETYAQKYVMQQASSDLGKDVRVYIVGGRITASVLRTSITDFRSNYCLGGHIELYELSSDERELVMQAVDGLSIGMAGIDFIFHHGRMVFNEIEDAVGARGLYALTHYDIVNDFVGYIYNCIGCI